MICPYASKDQKHVGSVCSESSCCALGLQGRQNKRAIGHLHPKFVQNKYLSYLNEVVELSDVDVATLVNY